MDLEELAVVHDAADNLIHVVRSVRAVGDNLVEGIFGTVGRVISRQIRRFLHVVLRNIAEKLADGGDHFLFVFACEMSHTTLAGMNAGAAELLLGNFFTKDLLNYGRAGEEHVAGVLAHDCEVGEGRRINGTAGAGAEDGADLGNHTRCKDIALENLRVTCESVHTFLDASSAGVVEADDRCTDFHSLVHDLADLEGEGF